MQADLRTSEDDENTFAGSLATQGVRDTKERARVDRLHSDRPSFSGSGHGTEECVVRRVSRADVRGPSGLSSPLTYPASTSVGRPQGQSRRDLVGSGTVHDGTGRLRRRSRPGRVGRFVSSPFSGFKAWKRFLDPRRSSGGRSRESSQSRPRSREGQGGQARGGSRLQRGTL